MVVQTRYFGEIDLTEDKIISFESGLMGFEDFKKFTILYDVEEEGTPAISWLQSLDEPGLALPVINPLYVKEDYDPIVEDELLKSLGTITDENLVVLLILNVPSDLTKMTANLKAPIIINSDTKKASQIIADNVDYEVKYNVFEAIQTMKKKKGVE